MATATDLRVDVERRVRAPVDVVPLVLAGVAITALGYVMLRRIGHPYELEWMEGGAVEHVRRVLHGQPLYQHPTAGYVAYTYPPLYWLTSAGAALLVGTGFLALRLVSAGATVGTLVLLATTGRRHSDGWTAGVVAAGIYAAAFAVTGSWYDVGRVDSLYVFLSVAAIVLADRARTRGAGATGGAVAALAVLTKQPAAIVFAPVGLWLLVRRRDVGVAFVGVAIAIAGATSVALEVVTHGWYRYITGDVLAGHRIDHGRVWRFWTDDLARHLWPAILLVAATALSGRFRGERQLHVAAAAGLVLAAWPSRFHTGGFSNNLMPAYAGVAVLVAVAFGTPHRRTWRRVVLAAAATLQLVFLRYPVTAQLPAATDNEDGRALIAALRQVDGDVFVVSHPYYGVLAGKAPHAQAAAISDVLRSRASRPRAELEASIADAVHKQRFAAIIFDGPEDHYGFPADLERYYVRITPPVSTRGPTPTTDLRRRPSEWWVPAGGRTS